MQVMNSDKFAMILETGTAEYAVNRHCSLMTIGKPFGLKAFGFAIAAGHPLKEALDHTLLVLRETGELEALEKRWWDGICQKPVNQSLGISVLQWASFISCIISIRIVAKLLTYSSTIFTCCL